jgi:hypothetical protein
MESPMDCGRSAELELMYLNRTEEYISLVERQSRMFRNSEAQVGRELDADNRDESGYAREPTRWAVHRESHFSNSARLGLPCPGDRK